MGWRMETLHSIAGAGSKSTISRATDVEQKSVSEMFAA